MLESTHETGVDAPRRGAGLQAALVAFVLLRLYLLLVFRPAYSDVMVYFDYAVRGVDLQDAAYADFDVEYPPLAWHAMALPRLVSTTRASAVQLQDEVAVRSLFSSYAMSFRFQMCLCDCAAFLLFLALLRRHAAAWVVPGAWGYILVTTCLAHVLYDRLDMGLLLLVLLAATLRSRACPEADAGDGGGVLSGWNVSSYFVLGLSISYKLIPAVAVPFLLLTDVRRDRRARGTSSVVLAAVTTAGVLLPFLPHIRVAGWGVLGFLRYHGERGIEVESFSASLLLLLRAAGLKVSTVQSFGSFNLESALSPAVALASTAALLLVLGGLFVLACRQNRDSAPGPTAWLAGFAVCLTLVGSKVLSVQYLVVALPLLILLSAGLRPERGSWRTVILLTLIATASTAVFPYLWYGSSLPYPLASPRGLVPDLHLLPCSILFVRNVGLIGLLGGLGLRFLRGSMPEPAAVRESRVEPLLTSATP